MTILSVSFSQLEADTTPIANAVSPAQLHIDKANKKMSVINIDESINIKDVYDTTMGVMMDNADRTYFNTFSIRIESDSMAIYTLFQDSKVGTIVQFNDTNLKLNYGYTLKHRNSYMFVSRVKQEVTKCISVPTTSSYTKRPAACCVSPTVVKHWEFIKKMVYEYDGLIIDDNPPEDLVERSKLYD